MSDPLFWLGLSLLLVAVSLTALLIIAIPVLIELSRAARSAEKLFDTLDREFPPTLESIRLTGLEISELTEDLTDGVKGAADLVKQVDRTLNNTHVQVSRLQKGTRRIAIGFKAAWQTWHRYGVEPRSPVSKRLSDEK
ncbi:conserved hypothetical protein [Rippkaea orientalis PCC 8801]|uniref:t-SNARE coiled-coil homology domain-containing protein n=1 Tax=Rippkaea orientalis (strain PCC 8801 / RF-1) TaxID=41431 RepID=B7K3N6_RIPO1|nr:hypothetical protein [Rippkaea orientalis]ACK65378.1 conserved hypothetical protein [Rippkaea orientalis PCC 8801]